MQDSTFRYFQLKICAKKLPGKGFRLDPLAVVFTSAADGTWNEIDRTERRLNEWNPNFSKSITLPADNDKQRRSQIRVDFYNKDMNDSRFLGTCQVNFHSLIAADGKDVELQLETPQKSPKGCRVLLSALEGYTTPTGDATISLQLAQTNFYGVAMTLYYEISRAGNEKWFPVFKSAHAPIDEQGWGQFPAAKIPLRDLTMDEESTGLLFSIYRYRRLGTKKLLGHFQASVKTMTQMEEGAFLPFSGNSREDLMTADVQVCHAVKSGMDYDISLRLVNCIWRAEMIPPSDV